MGARTYDLQQVVCRQQKAIASTVDELAQLAHANEQLEEEVQEAEKIHKEQSDELFLAQKQGVFIYNHIRILFL